MENTHSPQRRNFMTKQTSSEILSQHCSEIDQFDNQLLDLLAGRMEICLKIADLKSEHGIPTIQSHRVSLVLNRAEGQASSAGLDPQYLAGAFRHIIDSTCLAEDERILLRKCGGA
jgi:chorismate mutase